MRGVRLEIRLMKARWVQRSAGMLHYVRHKQFHTHSMHSHGKVCKNDGVTVAQNLRLSNSQMVLGSHPLRGSPRSRRVRVRQRFLLQRQPWCITVSTRNFKGRFTCVCCKSCNSCGAPELPLFGLSLSFARRDYLGVPARRFH